MAAPPAEPCRHDDWTARATLLRDATDDGTTIAWTVEIAMHCVACRRPMHWMGLPVGPSGFLPAVAEPAGVTLVVPCEPLGLAPRPGRKRRTADAS